MGVVERIDPEEDAQRMRLPAQLAVGYAVGDDGEPRGLRFHLVDGGRLACDRSSMVEPDHVAETTVEAAREEQGLAACRKCFKESHEELPDEVIVGIDGQVERYHADDGEGRPACGYGKRGAVTHVKIARENAGNLSPCKGCFGVAAGQTRCALCGAEIDTLRSHLPDCRGSELGRLAEGVGEVVEEQAEERYREIEGERPPFPSGGEQ